MIKVIECDAKEQPHSYVYSATQNSGNNQFDVMNEVDKGYTQKLVNERLLYGLTTT